MVLAAPSSTRPANRSANARSSSRLNRVRKYWRSCAWRESAGCSPARPVSPRAVSSTRSVGKPSRTNSVRTCSACALRSKTASNTALMWLSCCRRPVLRMRWAIAGCYCRSCAARTATARRHRTTGTPARSGAHPRGASVRRQRLGGGGGLLPGRRRRLQERGHGREDRRVLVVRELEFPAREVGLQPLRLGLRGGLGGARAQGHEAAGAILAAQRLDLKSIEGA